MTSRLFVTGATGLVGANICRAAVEAGHEVRALIRSPDDEEDVRALGVEPVVGDVLAPDTLVAAARGCDAVIHAAVPFAYGSNAPTDLDGIAVDGTANVLHAAHAADAPRVVITSSSVVFGSSRTPAAVEHAELIDEATADEPVYVRAKVRQDRSAQELATTLGIDTTFVCPTVVVGAHTSRLNASNGLIVQYLADPFRCTFGGGCNIVAAADVGRAHIAALECREPGRHFVVGGTNLSWREVHDLVAELGGVDAPRLCLTRSASYVAASLEELYARMQRRQAYTTREQTTMVGRYYWYSDVDGNELGIDATAARPALATALAWLLGTPHITRSVRSSLRVHPDVHAARRALRAPSAGVTRS